MKYILTILAFSFFAIIFSQDIKNKGWPPIAHDHTFVKIEKDTAVMIIRTSELNLAIPENGIKSYKIDSLICIDCRKRVRQVVIITTKYE